MQNGKHFYLGANTPGGFFSYYNYLTDYNTINRLYCIKGGPGSGKSTFMKTIASIMEKEGIHTDYIHCSSDDSSLDAIYIKELKVAFTDGTAPHITDPKYPGATDEIINLGVFWNSDRIAQKRQEIISSSDIISRHFQRAYSYLGAIKNLYDDTEKIYKRNCTRYLQNTFVDDILFEELAEFPLTDYIGKKKKYFASAITPTGFINRLDTILSSYKVYTIKGYADDLLIRLSDFICERGIDVEMYFCPLAPETKCEHLTVPDLKLGFTLSNEFHSYKGSEKIDLSIDDSISDEDKRHIGFNKTTSDHIFKEVFRELKEAKDNHDILESYYTESMDFEGVKDAALTTAKEILEKYR